MSHHVASCRVVLGRIELWLIVSSYITAVSCHVASRRVVSCRVASYHVASTRSSKAASRCQSVRSDLRPHFHLYSRRASSRARIFPSSITVAVAAAVPSGLPKRRTPRVERTRNPADACLPLRQPVRLFARGKGDPP